MPLNRVHLARIERCRPVLLAPQEAAALQSSCGQRCSCCCSCCWYWLRRETTAFSQYSSELYFCNLTGSHRLPGREFQTVGLAYSQPAPHRRDTEFVSNSLTTYHTYPYDNFVYPIFTVFPWCQRSVVSGSSGIYVVKRSTTRVTPVVADTVFWTSTPLPDTLYHCTSPRQSYRRIPL